MLLEEQLLGRVLGDVLGGAEHLGPGAGGRLGFRCRFLAMPRPRRLLLAPTLRRTATGSPPPHPLRPLSLHASRPSAPEHVGRRVGRLLGRGSAIGITMARGPPSNPAGASWLSAAPCGVRAGRHPSGRAPKESAAWWQCRAIGQRTPGKRASGRCSGHNEDCRRGRRPPIATPIVGRAGSRCAVSWARSAAFEVIATPAMLGSRIDKRVAANGCTHAPQQHASCRLSLRLGI